MISASKYINVNVQSLDFFQALSSVTRISIIELLQEENLSIQEISNRLNISSAMVTKHISILEKNGIVESSLQKGRRGRLKICHLKKEDVTLIFNSNKENFKEQGIRKEIPIGSFYDFAVNAPCGIATERNIVGFVDDPRVFYFEEKEKIKLIWFNQGNLGYHIPIYDVDLNNVTELEITLEICSEHPGFKMHFPSDIFFQLNDVEIGFVVSPGDFGNRKGILTPEWWNLGTQYGRLITIKINDSGSFIDEGRVSDVRLADIFSKNEPIEVIDFKISTGKGENRGGINLFGNKFGDFSQDIIFNFSY